MITKMRINLFLASFFTLSCMVPAASAQEGVDSIEEIIVTARFREESLLDIGASIKALTGRELLDRGINNVSDLASLTPSLNIQERGPNRNEISVRGVGRSLFQQDVTIAPPNIGLYFDEVPVNVIVGSQLDIRSLDLNRVEVVRGPQGTLFGEGAEGGAIRYFSTDPRFDEIETDLSLHVNSIADGGEGFGGSLTVNVPLSDTSGLRLSAMRTEVDGYIDNLTDNVKDNNGYEAVTVRGVFLTEPNDAWRVRLMAQYEDFDQSAFQATNPQDAKSRQYCCAGNSDDFVLDETLVSSLNIAHHSNRFSIHSITGYVNRDRKRRVLDHFFTNDQLVPIFFFGLPAGDPGVRSVDRFDWTQLSQEFRFVSNFDGPISFVAGVFYRDFEFDLVTSRDSQLFVTQVPLYEATLAAAGIPFISPTNPSTDVGELAEQFGLVGINGSTKFATSRNEGKQTALFGEATYAVNDDLRLIGGLRWHTEDIDLRVTETAATLLSAFGPVIPFGFEGKAKVDVVLPKVSIEWVPNESLLTYLTYSEGVRNGNLNGGVGAFLNIPGIGPEAAQEAASFGRELAKSIELGFKANWLDNRLSLNVAAFTTDIEDLQGTARVIDPVSSAITGATSNIGDAESNGFEFETRFAATDNVTLFAGANWTDSKISAIRRSAIVVVTAEVGQRIPFIPDNTYSLGIDTNIPLSGEWDFFGGASYQYTGEYVTFIDSPEEGTRLNPELGDYGTANLVLGVRNEKWSIDLRVTNLFDEVSLIQVSPTTAIIEDAIGGLVFYPPGTPQDVYDDYQTNRPRLITLTARVRF